MVASSMTQSVVWLDDAFQTVRLEAGSIVLGRITGNIDRPTVEMIPRTPSDDPRNTPASQRRAMPCMASAGPTKPRAGAISIQGCRA